MAVRREKESSGEGQGEKDGELGTHTKVKGVTRGMEGERESKEGAKQER